MGADRTVRKGVLSELNEIRMDFIQHALSPAVKRSADFDFYLKADKIKQAELEGFVRGLSILYYFSFLQSHIEEHQWEKIKNHPGPQRDQFTSVDWDAFDTFKYVRDCFGHSGRGKLFPPQNGNSKRFYSILKNGRNPKSVTTDGDAIRLEAASGDDCFYMLRSVLEEGNLVP